MSIVKAVLAFLLVTVVSLNATVLVKVNGQPITSKEVNQILMQATQGRFKTLPVVRQSQLKSAS